MMTNFQTRFSRNGRNVTCSTLELGASIDSKAQRRFSTRRVGRGKQNLIVRIGKSEGGA